MQSFINSNQLFLPLKIVLEANVCCGAALEYSNNLKIRFVNMLYLVDSTVLEGTKISYQARNLSDITRF